MEVAAPLQALDVGVLALTFHPADVRRVLAVSEDSSDTASVLRSAAPLSDFTSPLPAPIEHSCAALIH